MKYCNKFGMTISCSATYFLKVGEHFSFKVAIKTSLGSKKTRFSSYISNAKTRSETKNLICNIFGITICSSRTHYTEVSAHVLQEVATKSSFKGKNRPKIYFYYLGTFLKQKGMSATKSIELASLYPVKLHILWK